MRWSEKLWGENSKAIYLLIAASILLLTCLGGREIWTQEHRWADIVSGMFYRHDFLHPYLNEVDYYDKPLLSYWFIAAVAFISGELTTWTLRLPSALSGLLAIFSIYRLGTHLKNKQLGLLSGWLLLTTFYFVFWARTSSADMLNMAGILFAVSWYFEKKTNPSFFNYSIFFLILAITSLCKGLVGFIIPLIAILPDLILKNEWRKHLRFNFLLAMIPAAIIYLLPFWASAHFGGDGYRENGLTLVYRENILRYFQPFDHKGPIYTYFIFLPIYLLPWALFFIPALFSLRSRWRTMSPNSKWLVWAVLLLFLFFSLSGSRRNYYVLPMIPFAILMTGDWILANSKRILWTGRIVVLFFLVVFLSLDVLQPLYYAGGEEAFAKNVRTEATHIKPWSEWQFVMLDPESKVRFYLQIPPQVKNYSVSGQRAEQTEEKILTTWAPLLKNNNTIFITRKRYEPMLKKALPHYQIVEASDNIGEKFLKVHNENAPVAFIPAK